MRVVAAQMLFDKEEREKRNRKRDLEARLLKALRRGCASLFRVLADSSKLEGWLGVGLQIPLPASRLPTWLHLEMAYIQ